MIVIAMALVYGKIPNSLENIAMICGFSGVVVLCLNENDEIMVRN